MRAWCMQQPGTLWVFGERCLAEHALDVSATGMITGCPRAAYERKAHGGPLLRLRLRIPAVWPSHSHRGRRRRVTRLPTPAHLLRL